MALRGERLELHPRNGKARGSLRPVSLPPCRVQGRARRLLALQPGDENIPVARVAELAHHSPCAARETFRLLLRQEVAKRAQRRAQPAQADAQLVQVLWIFAAQHAGAISGNLRERGLLDGGEERGRRRTRARRRRAPLLRRRESGVTEGIRTPNNRNHNPGLYL